MKSDRLQVQFAPVLPVWLAVTFAGLGIIGLQGFNALVATLAASLVLIDAPAGAAYQHYRLPPTSSAEWLALAVLVGSGLLLLTAGRGHVAAAMHWARRAVRPAALAMLALALIVTSAAPSAQAMQYLAELLFAAFAELVAALMLVAAARTLPG